MRRIGRRRRRGDQHRVDACGLRQVALEPGQRHEDRQHVSLDGLERELSELRRRHNAVAGETQRAAHAVAPPVERLFRNRPRGLDPHQQRVAFRDPERLGERGSDQRPSPLRPGAGAPVKPPEAVVNAVDLDSTRPLAGSFTRDDALETNHRAAGRRLGASTDASARDPRRRHDANAPASASRKKRSEAMTTSVAPSRWTSKSRRLSRTDPPTSSAPERTATAAATPAMTARFVRQ